MADIEARLLSDEEYPLWDELVAASSLATMFEESQWFRTVAEIMGCPVEVLGVLDGGKLLGGMVIRPGKRFGMRTATLLPLCPTNSCVVAARNVQSLAKQERHALRITEALAAYLRANFSFAVVTNTPAVVDIRAFRWQGFSTNVLYTYQIDLESWDIGNLPGARRRGVQKAEKQGVVLADEADLDAAHALLDKTHQRHGIAAPITRDQLGKLCERMGERVVVRLAKLASTDEYLAVLVTARDAVRGIAYALFAGFDPAQKKARATSWLHWTETELCRQHGLKTFDLVGADVQSNVEFKSEFEGRLVPYYQVSRVSLPYRLAGLVLRG